MLETSHATLVEKALLPRDLCSRLGPLITMAFLAITIGCEIPIAPVGDDDRGTPLRNVGNCPRYCGIVDARWSLWGSSKMLNVECKGHR